MQEIKVSVIMPVYNVEDYLEQCLDSVVNQTLQEIEIICVDDGSTDRSGEILEEYAARDTRIKVLHQQNQYAGCARNLGLDNAVGKYVICWDSDDFFDLQALEKMYAKAEEDQAEMVVCGGNRMDNESGVCYTSGVYVEKKMLPEVRPFSKQDIPQYIFNFTTNVPWNKLYLKEFVEKHQLRYQPLRQANDVYFAQMALFLCERITVVDEPLVTYRMNNNGSLTGKASEARFCTRDAFETVWEELNKCPEFEGAIRRSFGNRVFSALIYSLRTQWNVGAYQELFYLYRDQLFKKFGIADQTAEFFYDEKMGVSYEQMKQLDAWSFMLFEFRDFQQRQRNTGGKLSNVRAENRALKAELKRVKQEGKTLARENQKLQKRVLELENSNAYKIGRSVTYVPGKLKKMLKKK